jgi:hypothetical protein
MARVSHRVLTALPPAPKSITLGELARKTALARETLDGALTVLSRRGFVSHVGLARYQRTAAAERFLSMGEEVRPGPAAGGERPPHDSDVKGRDTLRARSWRALRQLKKATVPELLELAARGGEGKHPHADISRYLGVLERFGIVRRLPRRVPGVKTGSNGFQQWLLLRDLGPRSPLWLGRKRQLIDRNTGREVPHESAA